MRVLTVDNLRVTNPFAGRLEASRDLHALSTPPAFILSQDQTLKKNRFGATQKNQLKKNSITS